MNSIVKYTIALAMAIITTSASAQIASKSDYLSEFKKEMAIQWPENRTLNIVFHGHSVPTGYSTARVVNSLEAYPHKLLLALKSSYRYAVINVITTSIGGEQAEQGASRFKDEVLTHRPDILFIDYALNDRGIGLERSEKGWRQMIEEALEYGTKVILLTPTPDLKEAILNEDTPLEAHSQLIRRLAAEYKVGLVDSYACFKARAAAGEDLRPYMSQNNHPNPAGHNIVAAEIITWFF